MKLSDLIEENLVISDLESSRKVDVLKEFVDTLCEEKNIIDKEKIIEVLQERERLGSTGIGEGIGIPHAKTNLVEKITVMYGRSMKGLEFDSLDNQPVTHVFLLLAPMNSGGDHLKALTRISRLLKRTSFKDKLVDAKSRKDIFNTIVEEDLNLD